MKLATVLIWMLVFSAAAPTQERVADPEAAVKIAEKALIKIYGKKQIESERPFKATLEDGVWTVYGTLNCKDKNGNHTDMCVGGVAVARISERDGRVLSTGHTK